MSGLPQKERYDKNPELILAHRSGDRAAGEALAELNRPLVYSIAKRFTQRGIDIDELCEIGTVGLVKAINTFDLSRECAFSTYAVPLIFGEIRRFLRDDGMIKVSRDARRLSALLNSERERRLTSGEDVRIEALATALGVSPSDAADAFFATSPIRSLDEAAYDDDDPVTLSDTVFNEDKEKDDFDKMALKLALDKLSDDQKKLILLRYFRDLSQVETAKILGLSQVKVSREEKKILASLKRNME